MFSGIRLYRGISQIQNECKIENKDRIEETHKETAKRTNRQIKTSKRIASVDKNISILPNKHKHLLGKR